MILQAPVNVIAALGDAPVNFTCIIQGLNLFWRIDGSLMNYLTASDFNNRGIYVVPKQAPSGQIHEVITMVVSDSNNNSEVICQGTALNHLSVLSDPATLNVAGIDSYIVSYIVYDLVLFYIVLLPEIT